MIPNVLFNTDYRKLMMELSKEMRKTITDKRVKVTLD